MSNYINGLSISKEYGILNKSLYYEHINQNESDFIFNEIFVQRKYLQHGISLTPNRYRDINMDNDRYNDVDSDRVNDNEELVILDVGANIGLFSLFCYTECVKLQCPKINIIGIYLIIYYYLLQSIIIYLIIYLFICVYIYLSMYL
jgi:hypothetical protein